MNTKATCPECGILLTRGETCQKYFYQMLFWEAENPSYGEVHHLMVLSFHLQHPNVYSPEGLEEAKHLLRSFLEGGVTPQQIRKHAAARLESGNRTWKITGTRGSHGTYKTQVLWKMTAADVVGGGAEAYVENVRKWSRSILESLDKTGDR